ncbi:hypothetical protein PF006_g17802, partial [Phytophthora fragariae]
QNARYLAAGSGFQEESCSPAPEMVAKSPRVHVSSGLDGDSGGSLVCTIGVDVDAWNPEARTPKASYDECYKQFREV